MGGIKSKILNKAKDAAILKKIVDKQKVKYSRWNLLYRASKHGKGEFLWKKHCSNKKKIVCLIKASNGNIFGGYTSTGWNGNVADGYGADDYAFLFLVRSVNGLKPRAFKVINGQQALYNQSSYYCFFDGNQCALYISSNGDTGNAAANTGTTYESYPQSNYLSGGGNTFNITELEVFQLKK